jgi:hypothetical protein
MWWRQKSGRALLRPHELAVIDAVLAALSDEAADLIERQLATRVQVSRIMADSDVMLYPERGVPPDPALALPNRSPDLRLAMVTIRGPKRTGSVYVSAVDGWFFMLEFRPGPRKIGSADEIRVTRTTVLADPMTPETPAASRLDELDSAVRAELEQIQVDRPDWAAALAAPDEMYSIDLDDGIFLVLAQLPDTDFVVARIEPPGPGIRRYDTDGDLVGEYATVQEAVESLPA